MDDREEGQETRSCEPKMASALKLIAAVVGLHKTETINRRVGSHGTSPAQRAIDLLGMRVGEEVMLLRNAATAELFGCPWTASQSCPYR